MRVLVSGALGFIGSHFVRHVVQNTDWEVLALYGRTYADDDRRVVLDGSRVQYLERDMVHSLTGLPRCDLFVNFASHSHVERSIQDPVPFFTNNVAVALNALEYARQVKVKKMVQVVTDEVFGPAPDGVYYREWDSHIPSNPYSASKSAQAAASVAWWRTYGVPVVLVFPMNAFGETQHLEKFIPKCVRLLREGKPVPVHAQQKGGEWLPGRRTWLHARNISDAILHVLRTQAPQAYPAYDRPSAFNIVGDRELSNLQVVEMAAAVMGVPAKWEFVDYHSSRPGHDPVYGLDGSKLKSTGWVQPLSFEESFARTIRNLMKEV